jgi:hypothetical protein
MEKAPAQTAPAPAKPKKAAAPSPLVTLRGLCASCQPPIKEGDLLTHLESVGATNGGFGTLEELAMSAPGVVTSTIDNWADIVSRLTDDVPM